ncbi:hypothetical protein K8352_06260 [Flavobacteriaceae bacterium F89]|uniref:Nicotinate-nucleotide adenylyltransferase n=1 Tax=Cerina litoralis TaxID=2874477 RepID=A0AAE3EUG0_9FLAO|nr:hypothetical protein [Cerina litoralis]MCG2460344.1 hypothetical protein [Cerina litoralis]
MKIAVICVIMLGMTNLVHAQYANMESDTITLSEVEVTPLNFDYRDKVALKNQSDHVAVLERKVSRFDIRESFFYDKYSKIFKVDFISKHGEISATYNREGKILKTDERFEKIVFPPIIQNKIDEEYPNWAVHKDSYSVTYHHENGVKQMYRAQLRKNGRRVNVKYGPSGEKLE